MLNVVQTNAADDKHVTHDCYEDGLTKMPDNVDKMRKQLCGPFTVWIPKFDDSLLTQVTKWEKLTEDDKNSFNSWLRKDSIV